MALEIFLGGLSGLFAVAAIIYVLTRGASDRQATMRELRGAPRPRPRPRPHPRAREKR
jgi:hypothetical protein